MIRERWSLSRKGAACPGYSRRGLIFHVAARIAVVIAPLPGESTSDTFVTDEYDEAPSGGDDDQPVNHP